MGLYTRPDSRYYWLAIERPGQRPIRRATKILVHCSTPQQAKENRRLAELEYHDAVANQARLRLDLPDARADVTVAAHARWYAAHHVPQHRGRDRETVILAHLTRLLGQHDLRALDRATAQEYVSTRLREGVGPATVNREMTVLKAMLSAAIPRSLRANPLAGMPRLRVKAHRKRMIRAAEEPKLLAHLHGETRDLYIVCVDTLLRQQSAAHLHRRECKGADLALEDSKTGPYTVPLSTRARAIIRRRIRKTDTHWIFPDWHRRFLESQPQASVELNRELRAAAKAAGLPVDGSEGRLSWHTATRATGATRMLQAGIDARTVQMIGNWRSFDQMAEYLELHMGAGRAAVNRIAFTSRSRRA